MKLLRVKNWERFQHYSRRSPPWIKLHRELLNDFAFQSLKDAARSHLMLIWVLAAGSDGTVPASAQFIASRIGASGPIDLDTIVASGLLEFIDDGTPQQDTPPTRKQKTPRTSPLNGEFEVFYTAYPKKKDRAAAEKAWLAIQPDAALQERILQAVAAQKKSPQWMKEGGAFIPHPASWLNGRRWEDEVAPPQERRVAI